MTVRGAPFIAVADVIASGDWYRSLLGCLNDHPDHSEYGKLVNDEGRTLLMLHCWDAEPEVAIDRYFVNPNAAPRGHGVLLTFSVDDLNGTLQRARAMGCDLVEELHDLPDGSRCFWVRDPNGYVVQLSSGPP